MVDLKAGDKAPDFTLPADGGNRFSLKSLRGGKVVLFFYPKDNTPGCTQESCDFRDGIKAWEKLGAQIVGVSRDSVASHDRFKAKYGLNFPLVSDEDGKACELYGVWVEKSLYGRKYMGIERATFLIDEKGVIRHIWRKVKVKDHIDDVQRTLRDLAKAA